MKYRCLVCNDTLEIEGSLVKGLPELKHKCPYIDEPWHAKLRLVPLTPMPELAKEIVVGMPDDADFFDEEDIEAARDLRTVPLFAALDTVRCEMRKLLERYPGKLFLLGHGYGVKMELVGDRLIFSLREAK